MTDILYTLGDSLYINLTNRCPCRCSFCIRKNGSHVGSAENLWFELEPHLDEVLAAFDGVELKNYRSWSSEATASRSARWKSCWRSATWCAREATSRLGSTPTGWGT